MSVAVSLFAFLQLVLSPILYPAGYIAQIIVVLGLAYRKRRIEESELLLLEPLVLASILCNIAQGEGISPAGYAVRLAMLGLRIYYSERLQLMSAQVVEQPITSMFLLLELLAAPHLYPMGYLAQLALLLFLVLSGAVPLTRDVVEINKMRYSRRGLRPRGRRMKASKTNQVEEKGHESSSAKSPAQSEPVSDPLSLESTSMKSPDLGLRRRRIDSRGSNFSSPALETIDSSSSISSSSKKKLPSSSSIQLPDMEEVKSPETQLLQESSSGEQMDKSDLHEYASSDEDSDEDDEEDIMVCKICFDNPVSTAFLNCGHICCRQCSETIHNFDNRAKCPFCNASIWRKVDVYFP